MPTTEPLIKPLLIAGTVLTHSNCNNYFWSVGWPSYYQYLVTILPICQQLAAIGQHYCHCPSNHQQYLHIKAGEESSFPLSHSDKQPNKINIVCDHLGPFRIQKGSNFYNNYQSQLAAVMNPLSPATYEKASHTRWHFSGSICIQQQ